MSGFLAAILTLGGLGLAFSLVLTYASQKFAVHREPKIEAVFEALPGLNCGVCGFVGCSDFAEAVVLHDASVDGCLAGGHEVTEKICEILGKDKKVPAEVVKAVVNCGAGRGKVELRYDYEGLNSCVMANQLSGGPLSCTYGCLGFGDCVNSCPFDAMRMGDDDLPKVDWDKCVACGVCVETCPLNIMALIPEKAPIQVVCNSLDKGKRVRKICPVGCIACKACEKACEYDAIHVIDNLAVVDYDKCNGCMACVEKCPTKCIVQLKEVAVVK